MPNIVVRSVPSYRLLRRDAGGETQPQLALTNGDDTSSVPETVEHLGEVLCVLSSLLVVL